jgi:hypothetical protein
MTERNETAAVTETAEELTEKSRLKSLFTARDEAAKAIRDAPLREYEVPKQAVDEYVQSAVTAYVFECEALFQNTEIGRDYWTNYTLQPISLPQSAPDELVQSGPLSSVPVHAQVRDINVLRVPESMIDEENWQIELAGIADYVCLPSPIKIKWTGHGSPDFIGESISTKTTQINIPRTLSEEVFRATNNLLADLDVGLDAEQRKDTEASYDYSDLL